MVCAGHLLVISHTAHRGCLFDKYEILCFPALQKTFHKQLLTFSIFRLGHGKVALKNISCRQRTRDTLCLSRQGKSFPWDPSCFFFFSYVYSYNTHTHTYWYSHAPQQFLECNKQRWKKNSHEWFQSWAAQWKKTKKKTVHSAFNDHSSLTTASPAESNNWIELHCNISTCLSLSTDCTAWREHTPQTNWS